MTRSSPPLSTALHLFALALLTASAGCNKDEPPPTPPAATAPPRAAAKIEIIPAPAEGEVAPIVHGELGRAKAASRPLLVYVGASWCEPCKHFHDAAQAGELDAVFPGLRLIEFDLDRDRDRLDRAGYGSKMIPLFALPREDGTGSGEQIEGSIKGPGAVGQIAPRLRRLLEERRGD